MSRRVVPVATVLVAMVLGAAFWSMDLGGKNFWIDEIHSESTLRWPVSDIVDPSRDGAHPPTYYLALRGWAWIFGDSDVALRGLSVLFCVGAVPAVYAVGRSLGGHRIGMMAMAICITLPFVYSFAQEARSYAMLFFLASLVALFGERIATATALSLRRYAALWAGLALTCLMLVGTHHGAWLFIPFAVAPCLLAAGSSGVFKPRALVAYAWLALGAAIYAMVFLPYLLVAIDVEQRIPMPVPMPLLHNILASLGILAGGWYFPVSGMATLTGVGLAHAAWVRGRDWTLLCYASMFVFGPVVLHLMLISLGTIQIPHPKALICILPMLSVVVAFGIGRLPVRRMWAVLGFLLVCGVIGSGFALVEDKAPPYKEIGEVIHARVSDSGRKSAVVVCSGESAVAAPYLSSERLDVQGPWYPDQKPAPDRPDWLAMSDLPRRYDDIWVTYRANVPCKVPSSWGPVDEAYEFKYDNLHLWHLLRHGWEKQWTMPVERYVLN